MTVTAEAEIARMLEDWTAAIRAHDLEGTVRGRSPEIVMFDVPKPLQVRGIEAYRQLWPGYFRYEGSRSFALQDTRIVAGGEVAWVCALLICTTDPGPMGRITLGLRRIDGQWVVEHEHHSVPVQ